MGLFGKKKSSNKSPMRLRGFPGDTNTDKCLLMAAEKGVHLKVELLDVLEGACDLQAYRDISPFGKCPCLQEGEFITSGALSILAYLDIRGQGGQLNPKKAAILGEQNYWCQIAESIAEPAINSLLKQKVCGPMHNESFEPDEMQISASQSQLDQVFEALESQLNGKTFIVGDYSYADIYWTSVAHLCFLLDEQKQIDSRNNVKAWFEKVSSRTSFASLPTLDDIKHKQLKSVA